jgi:hypothetical protein
MMGPSKRKGAAHRQREKGPPNGGRVGEENRHREAVAEEGSSTADLARDKPKQAQTCHDERAWNSLRAFTLR